MQLAGFIRKMVSSMGDVEKGLKNSPSGDQPVNVAERANWRGNISAPARDLQAQDALTQFRYHVGIHTDPDLESDRPVPNLGIYQRLVKAERLYKKQYKMYSWLINGALGLQIVFGAALTALGAGDGPRSAVTGFGAINTVLASVLSFLKGSGLPNRMKYYENELTKVREYIEQREREFARGNIELDLRAEIAIIEQMYETVKRDIELNTPDAYVSTTIRDGRQPPPALNRYASGIHREMDSGVSEFDEKYRSTMRGMERQVSQARLGLESHLSDAKHDFDVRVQETRADVDSRVNSTRRGLESRLSQERIALEGRASDAKKALESEVRESQACVDEQINSAKLATSAQVEQTRHDIETRLEETGSELAAQVEENRHGVETRLKEVQAQVKDQEEKIFSIVEKVAERVLAGAQQHRRQHDSS